MKISSDAIIPEEKLTCYLLIPKAQDDKSKFLAQAGFTQNNPANLLLAIRQQAESVEAAEDGNNEYGIFYRVEGDLPGVNGRNLAVVTIWLRWHLDEQFRFVTLKPKKENGIFYRVEGDLPGVNGRNLAVVTIWLRWHLDEQFRFVTLKPKKET